MIHTIACVSGAAFCSLFSCGLGGGLDVYVQLFLALQGGADPNGADEQQRTALLRAAARGHTRVVEMLLEAKADPNIADSFGQSPIMIVALSWHREIAQQLLSASADLNHASLDGLNALAVAAKCKNVEACRLFAKATSHVDEATQEFLEVCPPINVAPLTPSSSRARPGAFRPIGRWFDDRWSVSYTH